MIECGIRSTGITIGGGKSVFRASASTSIGREPLTASGACRWCPKWPCRPSSAATTTAGGCSREDGPPGRRLSSRRKLRFISAESPSDFLGWPVKAISRGKNSLLKYLKMFDGHFRCLFVIKVPLAEAARQPVELLRQPERWGIPTPSAAGHQLLNLKLFLSYIRSRSTKKSKFKNGRRRKASVSGGVAPQTTNHFQRVSEKPKIWRMRKDFDSNYWPVYRHFYTHTHIQHLFNWKKNPVP